jgi:hypothetical protein
MSLVVTLDVLEDVVDDVLADASLDPELVLASDVSPPSLTGALVPSPDGLSDFGAHRSTITANIAAHRIASSVARA